MPSPYVIINEYINGVIPHTNVSFYDENDILQGTYGGNFGNYDGNPLTIEGGVLDETNSGRVPIHQSGKINMTLTGFNNALTHAQTRAQNTLEGDDNYFLLFQNCVDFASEVLWQGGTGYTAGNFLHGVMDHYAEGIEWLRGMANDLGNFWQGSQGDTGQDWHNFFGLIWQTIGRVGGSAWNWLVNNEENEMIEYSSESPLVIDLNGDGIQTINVNNSNISFDVNGDGTVTHTGWISSSDGLLALDINNDGLINDGAELFGGSSSGQGFAKLSDYDDNLDGMISSEDDAFSDLLIWVDANSNASTDQGELQTLTHHDIEVLRLSFDRQFESNNGNIILDHGLAVVDGEEVEFSDVFLWIGSDEDASHPSIEIIAQQSLMPESTGLL